MKTKQKANDRIKSVGFWAPISPFMFKENIEIDGVDLEMVQARWDRPALTRPHMITSYGSHLASV